VSGPDKVKRAVAVLRVTARLKGCAPACQISKACAFLLFYQ